MIGFKEWVIRNAEQKKIAEGKAPDRNDSEKLSTRKIVKRILEHRSADRQGSNPFQPPRCSF